MYCLTCGCYISDILNTCPACGAEKGVKVVEKIVYKEVTKDIEIDYSKIFCDEPIFHYNWFNIPEKGSKEYSYLTMMLAFALNKYPGYTPLLAYQIKDTFPAFSDIETEQLENVLDDMAKDKMIDVYRSGWKYYCRKPITKEEEKARKKSYDKKYKYFSYHKLDKLLKL